MLTLDIARRLVDGALEQAETRGLKPIAIIVLDARGCLRASAVQDNASLLRAEVAHGKAYGALALGMGSRAIFERAKDQAYFVDAVNTLAQGRIVPVPGGVLIRSAEGELLGALGISGDTSDNDEASAKAAIEGVGLTADAG
ncbi:GlcG/HbpS family heme-binding protein [Terrihabitans sp. B22-R8]|uniref:GlcG/HbpS family heme-binding protein n=1 Tax=Terrihabitans sp. B22-R8 TaxID=3425128 RepID=UPI00403C8E0E